MSILVKCIRKHIDIASTLFRFTKGGKKTRSKAIKVIVLHGDLPTARYVSNTIHFQTVALTVFLPKFSLNQRFRTIRVKKSLSSANIDLLITLVQTRPYQNVFVF